MPPFPPLSSNRPLVSVVILNYNGRAFIEACLRSVLDDPYQPKEVILADNASTDGSMELAKPFADRIAVQQNGTNYGFPKGCNLGIRRAKGEIILLLNIDTEVGPGWLEALVQTMADDPTIAVAASKLLFPDRKTIQFAGGIMHPNGLTSHLGYGEEDRGQFETAMDCDYATGASAAIRRDALERLGGLDEGFPLYYEDLDLCFRAKAAGYRVVCEPKSVVYHFETFGTRKHSFNYYYKYHRGRLRFVIKNFGVKYFINTFLPAEWNWAAKSRIGAQVPPLLAAHLTQLPKAPWLWTRGFVRRRDWKTPALRLP